MQYDLEERTAKFGENIICFVKKLSKDLINTPLNKIKIVKSSTSVGANYMEANQASSKKILKIKSIFAEKNLMRQNIG